jgi:sulfhydrogenase subunit alpha
MAGRSDGDGPETRTFEVGLLARVEGEGRFSLRVEGDRVVEAHLSIFEAPRFFEAFLRGRSIEEVPDLVARICGICPVAYQMSAVRALENACDHTPSAEVRALRRLMYCGEWIESHALHVFLLHAPDFFGVPSAIELARDHREFVERGLRMKKAGNALLELLGGRAIHPVSVRVGGFSRVPSRRELDALAADLERCLVDAERTVADVAAFSFPGSGRERAYVALESGRADAYPMEWGDRVRVVRGGVDPAAGELVPVEDFEQFFIEEQVPHSTALQCRLRDGAAYCCGPLARVRLFGDRLHPRARAALAATDWSNDERDPSRSIVARSAELVHAFAEALDLIATYRRPDPPAAGVAPSGSAVARVGAGATEAPRGLLFHRYEIEPEDALVRMARIVPPTSQNQAAIEEDLVALAPTLLAREQADATALCEQVIRAYDPCISCATHFLRFDVERIDGGRESAPGS